MKLRRQQELVENSDTVKNKYFEMGKFLTQMDDAGNHLIKMLSSKSILDTVEVIKVFQFLYRYGFQHTEAGIRKMLTLVYSKDKQVVEAVIMCYQTLYFGRDESGREISDSIKVMNLLKMMKDATLTDITCIEELLGKLIENNAFERQVYNQLWVAYLKFGTNFSRLSNEMS